MSGVHVFGIAYQLAMKRMDPQPSIEVTATYAEILSDQALLRTPGTCRFQLPRADRFRRTRQGASEVAGLFGGVADSYRRAISETAERSIGDLVTVLACEVLDKAFAERPDRVLITCFGPPLPKIVGRLASLRLPDTVDVCWLSPDPLPACIGESIDESVILRAELDDSQAQGVAGWDDEPLLYAEPYLLVEGGPLYWLHALAHGPKPKAAIDRLKDARWGSLRPWIDPPLPRDIALSLDAVEQVRSGSGLLIHHAEFAERTDEFRSEFNVLNLADGPDAREEATSPT